MALVLTSQSFKEGATLPIGGLLAVLAPSDTPEPEIDAFVAGFIVPETTDEDDAEITAPSAQEIVQTE